jgi:hypothetical protein
VALGIGFQHLRHAGKVALSSGPEKLERLGIDAQMDRRFPGRGRLDDRGIAPKILV